MTQIVTHSIPQFKKIEPEKQPLFRQHRYI